MGGGLTGIREMVQIIKVLTILAEESRSVSSTHMVAHKHPQLQFQEI